jgi:T-complex protein 1 subunit gamma
MENYSYFTQIQNISAAKIVAKIIRTTLGPHSMLKMIIDNQGGFILTNDGFCVLREIEIQHPAAKSIIDLSKSQDNEAGDGTTTVVILSSELLKVGEILLHQKFHPNQIIASYFQALLETNDFLEKNMVINIQKHLIVEMIKVIMTTICTKLGNKFSRLLCELSIKAIKKLHKRIENSNLKNYLKIEKISFGNIEESKILSGIMIAKDISHPKMRRFISKPKILLLDCAIEFKKGESQTIIEMIDENNWEKIIKAEENYIIFLCNLLKKFKPDIIITEKGVSDLALHYFYKSKISVIKRVKKSDNLRLAKATGATIISSIEDLEENDFGFANTFEVKKIGEEYYSFITGCKNFSSCTILLFGASRDVLDEVERNFFDALHIAKSIFLNPKIIPGGGASELALSNFFMERSEKKKNNSYFVFKILASAFEIIPRTLMENFGGSVVYQLTKLKDIHKKNGKFFGIDGKNGKIVDMRKINVWETYTTKIQLIKSAFENAIMLLRIDRIILGITEKKKIYN